ncbi:MAG: polysulfide reductase NrfD, partial [Nitrospinae bacterium]|nr:polysulfide reductase NrfD [Nitrospinota bacterium]
IFLYTGLIPDVAAVRDSASGWKKRVYGLLAIGWRGTDRQWRHFSSAYLLFAGLATPLVVSVHSVVSWDFAMAIVPGWHSTIFAPYFVAGAIFSGVAMVLTLLIPLRKIFKLEAYITEWHFENLAKILLLTSLIVTYAYGVEFFLAWYSGNPFEQHPFHNRAFGYYAPLFWVMVFCNAVLPLALFVPQVRRGTTSLFVISIFINIGMWLERFIIVVSSLSHDYLPFEWGIYWPTWVEGSIIAGSFAWFFLWFLLFVKHLPGVSITEVKEGLTVHPTAGGQE